MPKLACLVLMGLCLSGSRAVAQQDVSSVTERDSERRRLSVEWDWGGSNSIPTPLSISQDGFPDIHISGAHYDTNPFEGAWYYAYRFGLWKDGSAWELEWVHHKVYLTNGPPTIQMFNITHGYNLVFVNRAHNIGKENPHFNLIRRFGVGPVITHPENIVRGQELPDGGGLNDGYYLSGIAGQAAIEGQIRLGRFAFLKAEGKVTGAWANVPVVHGSANVPNIAFHAVAGLGARF